MRRAVVLLAARDDVDRATLEAGVRDLAGICATRVGADAVTRAGVRLADDPLEAMLGARDAPGHVDAVIETSLPPSTAPDRFADALHGFGAELEQVAAPGSIAIMTGAAYLVWPDDGRLVLALAARRDPGISVDELRHWWIGRHAALVQELVRPRARGYDQLHVDRDLSRALCEVAGVDYTPYDMFDSIDVDSVADLTESTLMQPDTARRLYEDELGHVDHGSLRGALCAVVT
ncbi:MAG TPA: hypothetical protein VFC99_05335 [Acidimicrobiia bacterium]|nr:hypothetical protein [Acidimicrobiia bacterium]